MLGSTLRKLGPLFLITLLFTALAGIARVSAVGATDVPQVVHESGVNGCNGVRATRGSENTHKRVDPDFPSNFNPDGTVGYIIDYPVDPSDVSGRTTFV